MVVLLFASLLYPKIAKKIKVIFVECSATDLKGQENFYPFPLLTNNHPLCHYLPVGII